jgi:hypothetical protein
LGPLKIEQLKTGTAAWQQPCGKRARGLGWNFCLEGVVKCKQKTVQAGDRSKLGLRSDRQVSIGRGRQFVPNPDLDEELFYVYEMECGQDGSFGAREREILTNREPGKSKLK